MKKLMFFIPLILMLGCSSITQNSNQMKKEVQSTLAAYLNAGDKNNVQELDKYMHDNFRVTLYDGKEDLVKMVDKTTYRMLIENKTFGGYPRKIEYHHVEFIGKNMASINVTLTSPGKPTLKNFYSLGKSKGKWYIVQDFATLVL
ncbi:MAG: AtzH-like domain-containing protein [Saprospiraceae bacterium]